MSGGGGRGRTGLGVEDVLITPELARRPPRTPDHAAENRALAALAQEMSASPGTVLQRLTDLMVELGWAQSAGISILDPREPSTFRWHAVSGLWAEHVGGMMPFDASPCGVVVTRDAPLLFARPHEHFPAAKVEPLIREILLVPFHVAGRPTGTLWAIAHDDERKFDAEDLRVLTSLARFASAAHQLTAALAQAERGKAELEQRVEERTGEVTQANQRLRDSEAKYRTLFEAVDEGFCIVEVLFDGQSHPTDYRFLEVNPAFERHTGLHEAAGRTMRELAPTHEAHWFETYGRVALTGEPARFENGAEALGGRWFDVYAFRVGEADQRRVAILFTDITARNATEAALRGSEERQSFLLKLSDALRAEVHEDAVANRAVQMLSDAMRLDRCYITFYRPDDDEADFPYQVGNDTVPPLPSKVRLSDFPKAYGQVLEKTFVIDDDFERHDLSDAERANSKALGMRAMVASTLRQEGKGPLCSMVAVSSRPRRWTSIEIALVEETAERTWAAMERAHAAAALRDSETRFRALALATSTVIYIMSPDWTEMHRLDGRGFLVDTREPSNSWLSEYIHPDDQPEVNEAIQRAIREKAVFDLEHRVRRADGTLGWTHSRAVPLLDATGAIREWFGAASDVTARKRAEDALRDSEERLRQFGDASSDVLWIREAETLRWEYLTPAFERIYGVAVDQALSGDTMTNWLELVLPEDRERALGNIMRVRGGERVTFEYRIRRPSDGTVRWLRNTDFPFADEKGRVRRIGGIGHDITDIKEAEAWLRESEARLRATVDAVPHIAWTATPDGHHDYYNRRWYDYTGLTLEQTKADGWTIVIHPDDLANTHQRWQHCLRTGEDYDVEYRFRGVDGAYRWFMGRGVPVRGAPDNESPQGRVVRWIGTCTDIEDLVRAREVLARSREELEAQVSERTAELMAAEENLHQAQKMEAVGQLTGGIAHDFNNMLQGVVGGIAMARRQIGRGQAERAERYLGTAHDAAERAAGLTRRLLAFARRQHLEPRPVDADGLIAGLADMVRRTVGPGITVELRLRDGVGSVLCDPNELESALLNLCINARDAMPEGGSLSICTEVVRLIAAEILEEEVEPGTYVEISVADTGTGMAPETLAHVFEPFFTTKPLGEGTGLGLSQVWGFARQTGGLVRIESAAGAGTTVRLMLPLHEVAAAAETRAEAPPLHATPGATVLLVDDEEGARRPAADRLRELGLSVLEAGDGPEALRVLATTRPDLLVTDVGLPNGLNGRQVAEAAREKQPGLPVLFITGYAGTVLPPGVEMIGKPFSLDQLAQRVLALLPAAQDERAKIVNPRLSD